MEDTIVLYTTTEHLNTMSALSVSISKHSPSISVVLLGTAASAPIAAAPSITYRRLPTPDIPPNLATSKNPVDLFFEVPRLNNPNLLEALEEISQKSNIKAIVIDFFCSPAFEVCTSFGVPTYFCNTTSAFGLCAIFYWQTLHEQTSGDFGAAGFIEVPGCPRIESPDIPKSMLFSQRTSYEHFVRTSINMRRSAGIVVNSFHALEFRAFEAMANGLCNPGGPTPPVYSLGPFVDEKNNVDLGGESVECLRWLDLQPIKSVIFLCFGRRGVFSGKQLKEMAVGLENSGCRFIWAVRAPPEAAAREDADVEALLSEGFMERTKERGVVLRAFAPQVEVLSHESVGGFVTHCGQCSLLEAVSFGVPMIGWPLYAEQRMNRVFMVEEMKVALPLEEAEDGFVTADELEKRVRELMESEKGREVRRRVTEMKHSAAAAVREGGSTAVAMEKFMETVIRS